VSEWHIGPVLPTSAKGHCAFVTSWAVKICGAPASDHYLMENPRYCMFVCAGHTDRVATLSHPVDGHPVTAECLHPESEWQESTPSRPGFCFVPAADVELLEGVRELTATRG
jgi:hypothetical protein